MCVYFRILGLFPDLYDKSDLVNIVMPLVLAKYHVVLVIVGVLGITVEILVLRRYRDSDRERVKSLAEGISLICIFILQAGAVGWFITPLYNVTAFPLEFLLWKAGKKWGIVLSGKYFNYSSRFMK